MKKMLFRVADIPDFIRARLDVGSGKLQLETKAVEQHFDCTIVTIEPDTKWNRVIELERPFRANHFTMLANAEQLRALILTRFEVGNISVLALPDPISCGIFAPHVNWYTSLDIPTLAPGHALRLEFENPTNKDISFVAWLSGVVTEEPKP